MDTDLSTRVDTECACPGRDISAATSKNNSSICSNNKKCYSSGNNHRPIYRHRHRNEIVDGNAKPDVPNRREPGQFCGESEQPQTFIITKTNAVKIVLRTDNFTELAYFAFESRAEQQMEVFNRYGPHPKLYPIR
ncbi:uncharacterized protein LOC115264740 isoform X2 [Aedes albopictus]|uniref:Uncharacterized protein n=1 Tax=Aedes albopictus TaxID=7160 RepID=A0ABM1YTZ7_AEDAL